MDDAQTAADDTGGASGVIGQFFGRSSGARLVRQAIARAARTNSTVLLSGETGTGKEVAATTIHRMSARRDKPFVVVDCTALPSGLTESELFGHTRGAFTSATSAHDGAFAEARGGTVFLDEVGELPLELQPKLLRVLSSRQVKPLGGTRQLDVDVRVVAATNRDLWSEVNAARFRRDLYYRLAVIDIYIPPLRERVEDIAVFVEAFARSLGFRAPLLQRLLAPESLAALERQPWLGNVRELHNYIERCVAYEDVLEPRTSRAHPESSASSGQPSIEQPSIDPQVPIRQARDSWNRVFEHAYLRALLDHHGSNIRAAARGTGLDRRQLYRLLRKHAMR